MPDQGDGPCRVIDMTTPDGHRLALSIRLRERAARIMRTMPGEPMITTPLVGLLAEVVMLCAEARVASDLLIPSRSQEARLAVLTKTRPANSPR